MLQALAALCTGKEFRHHYAVGCVDHRTGLNTEVAKRNPCFCQESSSSHRTTMLTRLYWFILLHILPSQRLGVKYRSTANRIFFTIFSFVGPCHFFLLAHKILPATVSVQGRFVLHVLAIFFLTV